MVTILLTINRPAAGEARAQRQVVLQRCFTLTKPAPRRGVGFSTENTFENLLICSLRSLPTVLAPSTLP